MPAADPLPPAKKPAFLPFKRTAKRASTSTPTKPADAGEDESLSLFNQRKTTYFEDQQKLAAETAARREQAKREQTAKAKAKAEKQADERRARGSPEQKSSPASRVRDSGGRSSKRQRITISSGDETDSDHGLFSSEEKPARTARLSPTTPNKRRVSLRNRPSPPSSSSARVAPICSSPADIITLDDSDDDFIPPPTSRKGKEKMTVKEDPTRKRARDPIDDDLSDPELASSSDADNPITAKYILQARERKERSKQNEENSGETGAAAEILIESRLEGLPNLKIKIQISKKMQLVREAWAAKTKQRLQVDGPTIKPAVIDGMFFTWRGNKIYDFTTLSSLGIKPVDSRGSLLPISKGLVEGYVGWDKVHIEAWTQELYEQYQARMDRESRRKRGELDDDDASGAGSDGEPEPAPKPRLRLVLRSKNNGEQPLRVPPDCTVRLMVKAFRAQKKDKLPPDACIELHFDGEVLDETSTVEDAGIEDGDVIEVHLR